MNAKIIRKLAKELIHNTTGSKKYQPQIYDKTIDTPLGKTILFQNITSKTQTYVLRTGKDLVGYFQFNQPVAKEIELNGKTQNIMYSNCFKIEDKSNLKFRLPRDAKIDALYVTEKYRESYSGIGTSLVHLGLSIVDEERKLQELDSPSIMNFTIVDPIAVGFYEQLGAKILEITPSTYSKNKIHWEAKYQFTPDLIKNTEIKIKKKKKSN